jgi:transglutaminase-like putative cysteine protease
MLLEIKHRTHYQYSLPVYLEHFTVRLRPRSDSSQSLQRFTIEVTPHPETVTHCVGLDGNTTESIWFSGLHQHLSIEVHSLVETHYSDPFGFLLTDAAAMQLPLEYEARLQPALAYYRVRDSDDPRVAEFASDILLAARHQTIPFLSLLAEQIHKRFKYMLREQGDAWTPQETMERGQGSCRDFAMLFIDVCRSAGIASRFVSGYCIGDEAADSHMHAWAEVYLPGAGWRGFDPSRGLATSDDHVAVAVGQSPQDAAPTFGLYRGEASSSLSAEISIRLLENETGTAQ